MNSKLHIFLGGHDLEMETIAALALEVLGSEQVHDAGLSWGAKASSYALEIASVVEGQGAAILVELIDDLPPNFPRETLTFVDHHAERAGADVPASLCQVFDCLQLPASRWSRWYDLVCQNDIGHMRALRVLGASADEIKTVRDADRAAQGVTVHDEEDARRAIVDGETAGSLTIVRISSGRTSAVADFLEPEYGGPGVDQLLVVSPNELNFFGAGMVISSLRNEPGSWYGGALPERGFWGCRLLSGDADRNRLVNKIVGIVGAYKSQ